MTTTTRPRAIGVPIVRKDGAEKVKGLADYTADRLPDGLTYGVFATSPVANGRIGSLDVTAAERAPGVVAVLTHRNLPKLPPLAALTPAPVGQALLPMQGDRVRYEGELIALVVADTLERAAYAASLVTARIEPFPYRVAIGDALDEGSIVEGGYDEPDTRTGDQQAGLR